MTGPFAYSCIPVKDQKSSYQTLSPEGFLRGLQSIVKTRILVFLEIKTRVHLQ